MHGETTPFFLTGDEETSWLDADPELVGEFDLHASCRGQAKFLWQVSQPRFRHLDFLFQGATNYSKFLRLPCASNQPLVPT
jgi:hypothetical protein